MKITLLGAGSVGFTKDLVGDVMLCPSIWDAEIALYDIDKERLEDAYAVANSMNKTINHSRAVVKKYLGAEERKEALRDATFVINTIQVGGYDPCTIIDFEIPKKYGVRQTIGDTHGIGGIFRGLRTIHVMKDFAKDIEEVCPNAWLLNYTNPMAIVTGYMLRYTNVKTVGLCHSVQGCGRGYLSMTGNKEYMDNHVDKIAGINHQAWILDIRDKEGNDLYPLIRNAARKFMKNPEIPEDDHHKYVMMDHIDKLGHCVTEGGIHNSEYSSLYIKPGREDLIKKFNISLDEYPQRCRMFLDRWKEQREKLLRGEEFEHTTRSKEYASRIMEAMVTNVPYKIGGNVLNTGLITNLPKEACVEVPCLVDANGITPTYVGDLPLQLAAMNSRNIYPQLLTIEAAHTGKKEHIYHAAMMDSLTTAELDIDSIRAMVDELIEAHTNAGFPVL